MSSGIEIIPEVSFQHPSQSRSLSAIIGFRHSRRMLPMNLSANGFETQVPPHAEDNDFAIEVSPLKQIHSGRSSAHSLIMARQRRSQRFAPEPSRPFRTTHTKNWKNEGHGCRNVKLMIC